MLSLTICASTNSVVYERILDRFTELLRAQLRGLFRRLLAQAIVSCILLADKVHNFAARRVRYTVHVMRVTGIPGATVLLVTHQFVIRVIRLRCQAVSSRAAY